MADRISAEQRHLNMQRVKGHEGCKHQALPTTRREFWKRKLTGNVVNDKLNGDKLRDLGWRVITVWQCELEKDFDSVMKRLVDIIKENI